MATPVRELEHYHLPARIRAKKAAADSFSSRLAVADRIADLPGINAVEELGDTLPCRVNIYLQSPGVSIRRQHQALLLCTIDREGIAVYGLSEWDKHQVLRGGWGRLEGDHVLVFLPRDDEELEVCWGVLLRAYGHLSKVSARTPVVRTVSPPDLPRVSRTTLQ